MAAEPTGGRTRPPVDPEESPEPAAPVVAGGRTAVPPEQAAATSPETPRPAGRHAEPITPREGEILQLIADGCSTPEVAEQLFISPKTVKNHLASIYAKFEVRDRTQAVLRAVRTGIIHLD